MPTVAAAPRQTEGAESGSAAEEADVEAAARLASGKDHPLVRALGAASEIGDQPPLMAISVAVLAYGLFAGDRRATGAGGRMLGALLLATGVKTGLKRLVSRTRPNVLLDEGRYEVRPLGPDEGPWHSFPSGHTAGSVAVARAAGRVYPEASLAAHAAAAAIALIQVPRGAHYPIDVAAGALIGLGAEAVVDAVASRLGGGSRHEEMRPAGGEYGTPNPRPPSAWRGARPLRP